MIDSRIKEVIVCIPPTVNTGGKEISRLQYSVLHQQSQY